MTGNNMTHSSTNVTKYTKVLPVAIRKDAALFQAENVPSPQGLLQGSGEQREFLRFTLAYPSPSYGAMNPHKEIILRLTNDDNPLFFYHLKVTEAEFPNLRLQQGLLVDFSDFPGQLESLLDKCSVNSSGGKEDEFLMKPKFVLVMKISDRNTVLDIVESNPFKYLCHLSLQINPGSDSEVKKYLGEITTTLKKDLGMLQEKYTHLSGAMETELSRVNSLYEVKCSEFNKLREEVYSQTSNMTTRHFQELTDEKEKLVKLQSELVAKFDQERLDMDRQNKQAQKNLQSRITSLESEIQNLNMVKSNQESALQDATNRLRSMGDEAKNLQQELASVRQQNTKLDYDYHQVRVAKGDCQREIQSLEKTIRKNEETIQKQHESIINLSCEKKQLEEQKQNLTRETEKLRSSNKVTAAELGKANEIIKKLQDDIRSSHSKCKLQTAVLAENEHIIQDQQKKLQELEGNIADMRSQCQVKDTELQKFSTEQQDSKEKIAEYESLVQSHESMISWLNKQLNELQGLSELSKFRANLNQTEPVANKNESIKTLSSGAVGNPRTGKQPAKIHSRTVNDSQNNNASNNNNVAGINSLQGGSPSWLHIYQSTGNNNDHDLGSRLEHVSALGAILSQAQIKNSKPLTNSSKGEGDGEQMEKGVGSSKSNLNAEKVPTWAKNKPKVTLDSMINKPTFPIWKNK